MDIRLDHHRVHPQLLDNLGAHRPKRIRELVENRGAELVYLPSYSPEMNPIEEAFSKIKAMEEALCKITPAEAAGWFATAVTRLRFCTYEYRCKYSTSAWT